MQMATKVIKLDLSYSCAVSHAYQQSRHYLAPWHAESAEHFARHLLAYLSLYEQHPSFAKIESAGKTPDLFVQDEQQRFVLWCQVALVPEKRLIRASHQAEQVLLFLDEQETEKSQHYPHLLNQRIVTLTTCQLTDFCQMLHSHMALSVWRDDGILSITDGQHMLHLDVTNLEASAIH